MSFYKNLIENLEAVDDWFFHAPLHDYPALLAERAAKITPLAEKAAQLLPQLPPDSDEARRIAIVLQAETRLAAFLQPQADEKDILALNHDTMFNACYSTSFRTYRYMVWKRRSFPATATPQENGIAAVMRVRNEAHNLRVMLPVLLAYFDEIIIVDHQSTDDTYAYVAGLNHPKIALLRYAETTATAGEFYAAERAAGKGSLAAYYNFAFDAARAAFVCKWDADMFPLPTLAPLLQSVREGACDIAHFTGMDCFGYVSCNHEPRLYKRALGLRYEDVAYFESLIYPRGAFREGKLDAPVYLHMKQDRFMKMGSG